MQIIYLYVITHNLMTILACQNYIACLWHDQSVRVRISQTHNFSNVESRLAVRNILCHNEQLRHCSASHQTLVRGPIKNVLSVDKNCNNSLWHIVNRIELSVTDSLYSNHNCTAGYFTTLFLRIIPHGVGIIHPKFVHKTNIVPDLFN